MTIAQHLAAVTRKNPKARPPASRYLRAKRSSRKYG
jgi:hypothetical protein